MRRGLALVALAACAAAAGWLAGRAGAGPLAGRYVRIEESSVGTSAGAPSLPSRWSALDLTLAAGDMDTAVDFADSIARFLDYFGRWSERTDAMMEKVSRQLSVASNQHSAISTQQSMAGGPSSTVTQAEYLMTIQQGEQLLQVGREAEAEQVFREHPEMLVRWEDLAAVRINWAPKSGNVREIAAELNLGADALVLFDDNPVERAEVRANAPEVRVIEVPADPLAYGDALARAFEFDQPALL